jgi:hypothetical protein
LRTTKDENRVVFIVCSKSRTQDNLSRSELPVPWLVGLLLEQGLSNQQNAEQASPPGEIVKFPTRPNQPRTHRAVDFRSENLDSARDSE